MVYYYCAAIDSKIFTIDNDTRILGKVDERCAITGKELQDDAIEVHTKNGNIWMNIADKPEFIMQSFVSGNWYNPQNFHLILGKNYENLYLGFDELDKI